MTSPVERAPVIWNYPTRILFGPGASRSLAKEASRLGLRRALLVTDPGVVRAGIAGAIAESLGQAGVETTTFSEISSNPTESEVERGAAVYAASGAAGVVAVGGGAAMDTAKLILVRDRVTNPWEALDDALGGDRYIPNDLAPNISVPTTAGTGSEVGRAAVLTVGSNNRKTVIFSPAMLPRVAVLDPELTLKLPANVTAATGFDALTHCLEAYLAQGDHPLADAIAIGGLELVAKSLVRATDDGADLSARGDMMKAAMMGAAAFQKGLGACHSLAHPLSSECGLHHGLANALCLPAVVAFNEVAVPDRVARIGRIFGASEAPGGLRDALWRLRARVGLPASLSDVGINRGLIDRLADLALADACHLQNPRLCKRADFLSLLEASY